jgi:Spy/CpxP family protein refolding chaperone
MVGAIHPELTQGGSGVGHPEGKVRGYEMHIRAITTAIGLAALSAAVMANGGSHAAPYAGQDARAIASLSEQDIDALLSGQGHGYAKAAELNGYPGPAHVLELADDLNLSDVQRTKVQAIFDAMNAEARSLGAALVDAETALNVAFETGEIDAERLEPLVARSADIEAQLRAVHLEAHLQTKPLMNRHQIMLYDKARGYSEKSGSHGGHAHE